MRKRVELRVKDANSVPEREQLLAKILPETPKEVLEHFLIETASRSSERYVELLEYISAGTSRPSVVERLAAEEKILSLWRSAEPSLSDLYEYGGLSQDDEEELYDLLDELSNVLDEGLAGREMPGEITDNVFEYLEKDDYGTHEFLYDIALRRVRRRRSRLSEPDAREQGSLEEIRSCFHDEVLQKRRPGEVSRDSARICIGPGLSRSREFHRTRDWEEAMKVAEAGLEMPTAINTRFAPSS